MAGAFDMAAAAIRSLASQAPHDQALYTHLFGTALPGNERDDLSCKLEFPCHSSSVGLFVYSYSHDWQIIMDRYST